MEVCVLDTRSPLLFLPLVVESIRRSRGSTQASDRWDYEASTAQADRLAMGLRGSTGMQLLEKKI